jgi:hypothetical protein
MTVEETLLRQRIHYMKTSEIVERLAVAALRGHKHTLAVSDASWVVLGTAEIENISDFEREELRKELDSRIPRSEP